MKMFQTLFCVSVVLLAFFPLGCTNTSTVNQTFVGYPFIKEDAKWSEYHSVVYRNSRVPGRKIAVHVSSPEDFTLSSRSFRTRTIDEKTMDKAIKLGAGVYPFTLKKGKSKDAQYCGAIMVFGVDETMELAAFGKNVDTEIFREDFLKNAKSGILMNYTQTLDDKPVFTYWLGNRRNLYTGGAPNVEVDFSQISGLKELEINNRKYKKKWAVLDVYDKPQLRYYQGYMPRLIKKKHEFQMVMDDDTAFRGYIRNLVANASTAFVRIPCSIPKDLLSAAANGTVSNFTVYLEEGDEAKTPVAEIVFGLDTD